MVIAGFLFINTPFAEISILKHRYFGVPRDPVITTWDL